MLLTPANARRVTDQLATMRGAAMKVGQMLSMDTGDFLPRELSDILARLRSEDPRCRPVLLARNFGKSAALMEGFRRVRGRIVITMDADLQHPPALLSTLLDGWRRGFDVVHTRKTILFGCSSLTSQDPAEGLAAYDQLHLDGHVHAIYDLATRDAYRIDDVPHADVRVEIPPLFGIYLRHGAKICGRPAIDREFGTIDFLTLLDAGAMDPKVFQSFAG